jgi:hypothetical protein
MLITRKLYLQDQIRFNDGLWTTSGLNTVVLPQGTYELCLHGAGGAGGQNGNSTGGAGGVGKRRTFVVKLSEPTVMTFSVGSKGLTKGNGGNGGAAGAATDGGSTAGAGGGGGYPTWATFNKPVQIKTYNAWQGTNGQVLYTAAAASTAEGDQVRVYSESELKNSASTGVAVIITVVDTEFILDEVTYTRTKADDLFEFTEQYVYAAGGGGGGGGGAKGKQGRYSDGGSGGGGGGYYRFNPVTGETVSVAGKTGGKGGVATS